MISDFFLYVFAAGAVIGSLMMVTRRNPVSAVIFLVAVFFNISGVFLILDAHYVAAINVILYGGAIMVLFLFVIMLLNLGHSDWRDLRGPLGGLFGGAIAVGFLALLIRFLMGGPDVSFTGTPAGAALAEATRVQGAVGVVARPLFADYVVVLEVTGILLLAAIVGTILLAKRETA